MACISCVRKSTCSQNEWHQTLNSIISLSHEPWPLLPRLRTAYMVPNYLWEAGTGQYKSQGFQTKLNQTWPNSICYIKVMQPSMRNSVTLYMPCKMVKWKKKIAEVRKTSWIIPDGEYSDSWENAGCETKATVLEQQFIFLIWSNFPWNDWGVQSSLKTLSTVSLYNHISTRQCWSLFFSI